MNANFTAADLTMFRRFRIPQNLLTEAGVRRVTHKEAVALGFRAGNLRLDGILYPCLDAAGKMANGRVRLDKPEVVGGELRRKYINLSKRIARHMLCFLRSHLVDDLEAICLVESEKAMLACIAAALRADRKILFFAMGGAWGLWERRGDESVPVVEVELLRDFDCPKRLMLDADVAVKREVKMAEDNAALLLGPGAEIVRIPQGFGGLDDKGPDDFLAVKGDKPFWVLWDAPAGCGAKAVSPLAMFRHEELHVNVDKATRLLATMPEFKIYRRANGLVHIVEELEQPSQKGVFQRPKGNTYLTQVDADHIEMELSRSGYVFSKNLETGKIHSADPKLRWAQQVISQLRSRPEGTYYKRIERISNVPLLLADGRLVSTPGYDEETCVWFDPRGVKFPPIPAEPTEKQARKAVAVFEQIYGEFPLPTTAMP